MKGLHGIALLLLSAVGACAEVAPGAGVSEPDVTGPVAKLVFERAAMGTRFRITICANAAGSQAAGSPGAGSKGAGSNGAGAVEARARAAADAAFELVRAIEAETTDWDADSRARRLTQIGPSEAAVPVRAGGHLLEVLRASDEWVRVTGGAFDPAAGPIFRLWRRALRQGELPSGEQLSAAVERSGWARLRFDAAAGTVAPGAEGMLLDFGGIAKGWAADRALALLAERGFPSALVDAGGDLAVGASPPGEDGWSIAVDGTDGAQLRLANVGVASSGDRYRGMEANGVRYGHIADPRTGWAVLGPRSATVIAPTAGAADALASALCVEGSPGLEWIEDLAGVEARVDGGALIEGPQRSSGFAARLR